MSTKIPTTLNTESPRATSPSIKPSHSLEERHEVEKDFFPIEMQKICIPTILQNLRTIQTERDLGIKEQELPKEKGITFYVCSEFHNIFELDVAPNIIFKMSAAPQYRNDMEIRFEHIQKAHEIKTKLKLEQIVIPKTKRIELTYKDDTYTILAQEKLDFAKSQERLYSDDMRSLDTAIAELTRFIIEMNYSDVKIENLPILNGNRKIGVIDLEDLNHRTTLRDELKSLFSLVGRTHKMIVEKVCRKTYEN
ncbi:MAG: hypothetical protein S4CHLAM20_11490 [Chlamydiia bacterium]|nr:hypothetical protein [Chlamydiia bacterium]